MKEDLCFEIQNKTIRKLFNERADFIIIGLTGAIDSDLSKITDIMGKNFEELYLPETRNELSKLEQLEYCNVYNYAKKHWKKFDVIKARDIIVTYILENYESLSRFYSDLGTNLFQNGEFANSIRRDLEWTGRNLVQNNEQEVKKTIELFLRDMSADGLEKSLIRKNNELGQYIKILRKKEGNILNARTDLSLFVYTKYVLPSVGKSMRVHMGDNYIKLFQRYGNEIRFFGSLDMNQWEKQLENIENLNGDEYCFSIAKRINTFIKIRRSPKSNEKSVPVRIVIDSLKNPYECSFLKDRYSAYYTFAILSRGEQEYDDERFAEKNQGLLFETPNLIKKGFKEFIRIVSELLNEQQYQISSEAIDYLQKLEDPEKFLGYLCDKLQLLKPTEQIEICPNLERVSYKDGMRKYEQAGIMENEFKFYLEILKDPVRTFCMISDLFPFYLQDIQSATQNADVFLSGLERNDLGYKIVRYISLIMHPGLVGPTKEERCMQVAFSAKANSGCISRQVGAVVTDKDYNILSLGWNDVHCGKIPCALRTMQDLQRSSDGEIYSDLELRDSGIFRRHIKNYDFTNINTVNTILEGLPSAYCFKSIYNRLMHGNNPEYSRAIHAEARAFWACDKERARGGCLFTTSSSCENCTILVNEYGIKRVYYIEKYAGISQEHVNAVGKMENRAEFILFEGAIGNAYMKMYTPVMPLKDELMLRGIEHMCKEK